MRGLVAICLVVVMGSGAAWAIVSVGENECCVCTCLGVDDMPEACFNGPGTALGFSKACAAVCRDLPPGGAGNGGGVGQASSQCMAAPEGFNPPPCNSFPECRKDAPHPAPAASSTGLGILIGLLAALGGCTGMDAVSVMAKKKVGFDEYRVEVVGQQRAAYPRSYTSITVEHIVRGKGIDDKAVARAIELSARKYCMVGATIATGDCTIAHRMRIIDEKGERTCDCLSIGPKGAGLSHYQDA